MDHIWIGLMFSISDIEIAVMLTSRIEQKKETFLLTSIRIGWQKIHTTILYSILLFIFRKNSIDGFFLNFEIENYSC